jgi:putative glutamine amidotransferase
MDVRRQENDYALAAAARRHGIPTLGICLGLQMMNDAAGGTLVQDIDSEIDTDLQHASEPENRRRHEVFIKSGTTLGSILRERELTVNSSHHQAVRNVGAGFRVTAEAPDGVVEGLEDPQHPFYLGVQWHPEDMNGDKSAAALFGAFVEAARRHAEAKRERELSPAGTAAAE